MSPKVISLIPADEHLKDKKKNFCFVILRLIFLDTPFRQRVFEITSVIRSLFQCVSMSVSQLSVFLRNSSYDFSEVLHEVRWLLGKSPNFHPK